MVTPARSLVAVGVAMTLAACAGQLAGVVRAQAAQDFGCPEAQIEVNDLRSGNSVRDFGVTGCGRQAHYQAACGMVGGCVAYRPGEAARDPLPASEALTAGVDDLRPGDADAADDGGVTTVVGEISPDAGAGGEARPPVPGAEAVGDTASGSGAEEAAEARLSATPAATRLSPTDERTVTLRNACARRVVFYIGKQPGQEGGRYMTLGSTNMISPRLRPGDQVWLLDAQQAGLTSVSVDGSTQEIVVAESCAGLTMH